MIAYRQSALRNFWHENGLKCRRTPSMYMQTTLGPLGSVHIQHIHLHSWSIESTELLYIKKNGFESLHFINQRNGIFL